MTYITQVDATDEVGWNLLLSQFADATIYQTWANGSVRSGVSNLSHLVLRTQGEPVAMAQVRIRRLPFVQWGLCRVDSAPLWQRRDGRPDLECLRHALRALREEYAIRRKLALIVVPNIAMEDQADALALFSDEGFRRRQMGGRTILMDLTPRLEDLRAGVRATWRHTLNKAEQLGLELVCGETPEMLVEAIDVYDEMHARKGFSSSADIHGLLKVQALLAPEQRLKVMLCRDRGEVIAAIMWTTQGRTGRVLMAATRGKALEYKVSNLLWWKVLEWLKTHAYECCDLGGINRERNPGGYTFKSGIAKTHGREVTWLGEFMCCPNPVSATVVSLIMRIKSLHALSSVWRKGARRPEAQCVRGVGPVPPAESPAGLRPPVQE